MNDKTDNHDGQDQKVEQPRKPFIEPVISQPKDALEATALFLGASPFAGGVGT